MRTVYIVGGVAIAGGALWYLTRKPAAPAVVPAPVVPGISTFNKICRPIASAGLQAGAASQGAPPTATAGIASQAASLLCDLDSAVIKYAGKGIVYAGKGIATGSVYAARGVATAAVATGKAVATGAVAVEHVAVAVAKAPVAVVTTVATAGKTVVTSVGGAVGHAGSSVGHAISSVFSGW